jgi:hypothetical protein
MAAFFGIAVLIGFPAVDSTFLLPLHSLVERAGREARPNEMLVLATDSRRPSALFYLPDPLLPVAGRRGSRVKEITGLDSLESKSPDSPHILILPSRVSLLHAHRGAKALENERWAALRIH